MGTKVLIENAKTAWSKYKAAMENQSTSPEALEKARDEYIDAMLPTVSGIPSFMSRSGHPMFFELLGELAAMHEQKNAGYAGRENEDPLANFRVSKRLGVPAWRGCLVRWSDKVERVFNLVADPENEQVGESLRDTLMDCAAYCLLTIILSSEQDE